MCFFHLEGIIHEDPIETPTEARCDVFLSEQVTLYFQDPTIAGLVRQINRNNTIRIQDIVPEGISEKFRPLQ